MAESKKVLVADDDLDIRAIISGCIAMLGFNVFEAKDGAEAIRIAEREDLDLAVLDYMMPEKDGLEVCRHIKDLKQGEYVPVILLTAREALSDKVKAFQEGTDDYLTKPFHYEELQARVKAQIRLRELNQSIQAKNQELQQAQNKIIEQERQLLAMQFAGATSHNLGQPLSAIILNCHLIEKLEKGDKRYQQALAAIRSDTRRMTEILEQLKTVDVNNTKKYHGKTAILNVEGKE